VTGRSSIHGVLPKYRMDSWFQKLLMNRKSPGGLIRGSNNNNNNNKNNNKNTASVSRSIGGEG
jgi:hypothetical protein